LWIQYNCSIKRIFRLPIAPVKRPRKGAQTKSGAKPIKRLPLLPNDYSEQWEILPRAEREYRAAAIYEYSRESRFLLKLIFDQLYAPMRSEGETALDIVGWMSTDLRSMVGGARQIPGAWVRPWVKLKQKDRNRLVAAIQRPVGILSVNQIAELIGPDPPLEIVEIDPNDDQKARFVPISNSNSKGKDPRVLLPLFVDSSLTGRQLIEAVTTFLKREIGSGVSTLMGRGAGDGIWKKRLLDLAALRLLSTRSNPEAVKISRIHLEDWRGQVLYSADSCKMRVRQAVEDYGSIFEIYDEQIRGEHTPMISLGVYLQKHPRGRPRRGK